MYQVACQVHQAVTAALCRSTLNRLKTVGRMPADTAATLTRRQPLPWPLQLRGTAACQGQPAGARNVASSFRRYAALGAAATCSSLPSSPKTVNASSARMAAPLTTAPPKKHPVLPMPRAAVTSHKRPARELEYASATPEGRGAQAEGNRRCVGDIEWTPQQRLEWQLKRGNRGWRAAAAHGS